MYSRRHMIVAIIILSIFILTSHSLQSPAEAMRLETARLPLMLQTEGSHPLKKGEKGEMGWAMASIVAKEDTTVVDLVVWLSPEGVVSPLRRPTQGVAFLGLFPDGPPDYDQLMEKGSAEDTYHFVTTFTPPAGEHIPHTMFRGEVPLPAEPDRDGNGFLEAQVIMKPHKQGLDEPCKGEKKVCGVATGIMKIPLP